MPRSGDDATMRCTLLGTGDVTGVPAPFRDLDDAGAAARRRRPGLLVETDAATLLLDVPPDFREGVRDRGVRSLDATFVTHWHHDHVGGIDDLSLAARADVVADDLYRTPTAGEHFEREKPYLGDRFDEHDLAHGDPVTVADATVTPIPVRHDRPAFDTLAFRVETEDAALVYAPDFGTWCPDMPGGDRYRDADLAILEATSVVAPHVLDDLAPREDPVADAAAHRTVLVHLNEHLLARDTATIAADVADQGYELGADLETYVV
jgi:phosphoribosyl 1,2-cyclic phosphate phosphodiesterase